MRCWIFPAATIRLRNANCLPSTSLPRAHSRTLQTVLDPINSGALINGGATVLSLNFSLNPPDVDESLTGESITLTWNAPGAQSCAARGGINGDGWSGSFSPTGSLQLTEHTVSSSIQMDWLYEAVNVQMNGPATQVAAAAPDPLQPVHQ